MDNVDTTLVVAATVVGVGGLPGIALWMFAPHPRHQWWAGWSIVTLLTVVEAQLILWINRVPPRWTAIAVGVGAVAVTALFGYSRVRLFRFYRHVDALERATGQPLRSRLVPPTWFAECALGLTAIGALVVAPLAQGSYLRGWSTEFVVAFCSVAGTVLGVGVLATAFQTVRWARAVSDYRFQLAAYELTEPNAHHDGS